MKKLFAIITTLLIASMAFGYVVKESKEGEGIQFITRDTGEGAPSIKAEMQPDGTFTNQSGGPMIGMVPVGSMIIHAITVEWSLPEACTAGTKAGDDCGGGYTVAQVVKDGFMIANGQETPAGMVMAEDTVLPNMVGEMPRGGSAINLASSGQDTVTLGTGQIPEFTVDLDHDHSAYDQLVNVSHNHAAFNKLVNITHDHLSHTVTYSISHDHANKVTGSANRGVWHTVGSGIDAYGSSSTSLALMYHSENHQHDVNLPNHVQSRTVGVDLPNHTGNATVNTSIDVPAISGNATANTSIDVPITSGMSTTIGAASPTAVNTLPKHLTIVYLIRVK